LNYSPEALETLGSRLPNQASYTHWYTHVKLLNQGPIVDRTSTSIPGGSAPGARGLGMRWRQPGVSARRFPCGMPPAIHLRTASGRSPNSPRVFEDTIVHKRRSRLPKPRPPRRCLQRPAVRASPRNRYASVSDGERISTHTESSLAGCVGSLSMNRSSSAIEYSGFDPEKCGVTSPSRTWWRRRDGLIPTAAAAET